MAKTVFMRHAILSLFAILCVQFVVAQDATTVVSSAPVKEFLSSFTAINVDAPIKLQLIKIGEHDAPYIVYDTKGNETSKFTFEVDRKNSILKISERTDYKRETITEVTVYFNRLTDISISKADVTVEGIIESKLLDIYTSNDAHLIAEIDVLDLMLFAAGKSRIMLSGTAHYHTADVSAAEYDAGRLNTTSTIAEASHNAVMKVDASERLELKTATGGKIYYVTHPVILRSEVTLFGGEISKI